MEALHEVWERQHGQGGTLLLAGVQPKVQHMMTRAGLVNTFGEATFFWSADRAIISASHQHQADGCPACASISMMHPAPATGRLLHEATPRMPPLS